MKNRLFGVIAIVTLVLASATAHGIVTNRWNGGDATPAMPQVSMSFGDWIGEELKSQVKEPGLANITRRYVHGPTGKSYTISLTVGRSGLTSQHTPDYCYAGSGYTGSKIDRRLVELPEGQPAELFTTEFRKQNREGAEEVLRIFWGWSADSRWAAPKIDPRFAFLGKPVLYKLYIVAAGAVDFSPGRDPVLDEFLTMFISTLNRELFSGR